MSAFKTSVCIAIPLFLSGCSKEAPEQALMQTYVSRVANVLDEEYQWQQPDSPPPLPSQRLRLQTVADQNEGLIDVLDLAKCNLLPLIASRNSSLGKLASPSQRLIYEVEFLHQISDCLPLIKGDPTIDTEVKERIESIYQVKKANLPFIFWNALYTGQEIEASMAMNQAPIPLLQTDYSTTLNALNSLSFIATSTLQSQASFTPPSLTNIEQDYEAIYHQPLGTPLLKSLLLLEATMSNVTNLINTRLTRRPMCFTSMQNPKANILKNIFVEYYARQIQPYMAYVHRLGDEWFSIHTKTLKLLPVPTEVTTYTEQVFIQNSKTSIWERYIVARDKHTSAWQKILKQCNLMPGEPN